MMTTKRPASERMPRRNVTGQPNACIACRRALPADADQDPYGVTLDVCSVYAFDVHERGRHEWDPWEISSVVLPPGFDSVRAFVREHKRRIKRKAAEERGDARLDRFSEGTGPRARGE